MSPKSCIANNRGMTLLELLLVVTILSAVAWMSLGVVGNRSDQFHFDETRRRLDHLRYGLIGDSSRSLNGQSQISGYIADMGKLPDSIDNLLLQGSQAAYAYDATYGLWAGWHGPYITATEHSSGPDFKDGWGNSWIIDPDTDDDGDIDADDTGIIIQSLGRNGDNDFEDAASANDADSTTDDVDIYDADYPPDNYDVGDLDSDGSYNDGSQPLIAESSYQVTLTDSDGNGGIRVEVVMPSKCWRCSDDPETNRTRSDCIAAGVIAGDSYSWDPLVGFDDYWSCTDPNIDGVWLPSTDLGYACVDASVSTKSDCVAKVYSNEDVTAQGRWMTTSNETEECVDRTRTEETVCKEYDYDDDGTADGDFVSISNNENEHCSDTVSTDQNACELNSGVWYSSATEPLCVAVTDHDSNGSFATPLPSQGSQIYVWNGSRQVFNFPYAADTSLFMGPAAYGVFEYDESGSSCDTDAGFRTDGEPQWQSMTIVPGVSMPVLPWSLD